MKTIEKIASSSQTKITPGQILAAAALSAGGGALAGHYRGKALAKDKKARKEIGKKYVGFQGRDLRGSIVGLGFNPVATATYNEAKRHAYNKAVAKKGGGLKKKAEFVTTHNTGTSDRKSVQKDPERGTAEKVYDGSDKMQNSDVKNNIISKMIHL